MSPRRTRTRKLAAVGLLAAVGFLLTACNSDEATSSGGSGTSGGSSTSGSGGAEDGTGGAEDGAQDGFDGMLNGKLSYLAPGKLLVGKQAFHLGENTVIVGGDICSDPETPEADECTVEQLESAVKRQKLTAEVTIENGVAQRVDSGPGKNL